MSGPTATYATYLLIGSWVNMILYGTEISLAGFYFLNSKPPAFFRWSLLVALCIDSVCTVVLCFDAYPRFFLDPQAIVIQPWTAPTSVICTYTAALVEHVFFTRRYWQITHDKLVTIFISLIIVSNVALSWVLGFYLYASGANALGFSLAVAPATLCAATDLFIVCAMFRALRSMKTTYKVTQSLLHRILVQSVACGFTTSIATIAMLSFLMTHNINPFTIVFDILGRLYTLTMLVNYIILRKKPVTTTTDSSEARSTSVAPGPRSIVIDSMNTLQTFTVPTGLSTISETHPMQNSANHARVVCNLTQDPSLSLHSSQRQRQLSAGHFSDP